MPSRPAGRPAIRIALAAAGGLAAAVVLACGESHYEFRVAGISAPIYAAGMSGVAAAGADF